MKSRTITAIPPALAAMSDVQATQLPATAYVLVTNGFYAVTKRIWIEKGVKFRGLTGNPEDVILANSNSTRVLYLNHADALAAGFVVEGGTGTGLGRSLYIDTVGGMVSNCVIRGTQLSGSVASGSAPSGLVPAVDLAGASRVFGKAIDIGCLESHQSAATMLMLQ